MTNQNQIKIQIEKNKLNENFNTSKIEKTPKKLMKFKIQEKKTHTQHKWVYMQIDLKSHDVMKCSCMMQS